MFLILLCVMFDSVRFLFRVIYLSVNDIISSLHHPQPNCDSKVCLLSEFILTCQYIVQSGKLFIYLNIIEIH